ncbi:lipoprotein [Paractinoplanes lichenicola]|uniref:Lipoprotein n=1 Tax=Paractinoplanes lichenicola TaxID=2802976 RepID=A0ABS1VH08_9ACTN|nr:lipoprotein [Actinoplanes lichenicola]MBL7253997.1 hypothetical protein [Actinoplanes lichenicola]
MRQLALAGLGAAALALAACDSGNEPVWTPPAATAPSAAAPAPGSDLEATRVGAAGSGCELPVTFGVAESWKPKAVAPMKADDPLAELTRRGPMTMKCEIDAKPAGNIGFLRVYTGKTGDLEANLTAFAGATAQEKRFRAVKVGDREGLEVVYKAKNPLEDVLDPERAFAVATDAGLVVVALDSLDSGEYEEMLPAYELAKSSLTATS